MQSRDCIGLRRGFDEVMLAEYPWLAARPTVETRADAGRTDRVPRLALRDAGEVRAAYLMEFAVAMALERLAPLRAEPDCTIIAHELTDATRAAMAAGRLAAIINQDVGHLVRSAQRVKAEGSATIPWQKRIRIEIMLQGDLPVDEGRAAAE